MRKLSDSIGSSLESLIQLWESIDHPGGPCNAAYAGPFDVTADGRSWRVVDAAGETIGVFEERGPALCAAAALPILGRHELYRQSSSEGEFRSRLSTILGPVADLRYHDDALTESLGLLAQLVAEPTSFGYLIEAAGADGVKAAISTVAGRWEVGQ